MGAIFFFRRAGLYVTQGSQNKTNKIPQKHHVKKLRYEDLFMLEVEALPQPQPQPQPWTCATIEVYLFLAKVVFERRGAP